MSYSYIFFYSFLIINVSHSLLYSSLTLLPLLLFLLLFLFFLCLLLKHLLVRKERCLSL